MKFESIMTAHDGNNPRGLTLNLTENIYLSEMAEDYSEQVARSIDAVGELLAIATSGERPSNVIVTRVAEALVLLNDLNISMRDIIHQAGVSRRVKAE